MRAPDLAPALDRLLEALAAHDALRGLDARAILPVAASAHGRSVASVRPLDDVAETVDIGGRARRWELALRPLFFLTGDPAKRLTTLVHELLHIDPAGGLRDDKRHASTPKAELDDEAAAVTGSWLESADPVLAAPLGHDGVARLPQWRVRPIDETAHRHFTDADLCDAWVDVVTPPSARTVWW
jgi:hypothetical protein